MKRTSKETKRRPSERSRIERSKRTPDGAQRNPGSGGGACVPDLDFASLHPGYNCRSPRMPAADPHPYVYVNADGTARELRASEQKYLETEFKAAMAPRLT